MATTSEPGPNKTAFVRELLESNPKANVKVVNEAWGAAGHEGTVSETLVQRLRSKLGLTGNIRPGGSKSSNSRKRSKPKKAKTPVTAASTESTATKPALETPMSRPAPIKAKRPEIVGDLEAEFDRLLYRVMEHGELPEIEESLRQARRHLIIKLGS